MKLRHFSRRDVLRTAAVSSVPLATGVMAVRPVFGAAETAEVLPARNDFVIRNAYLMTMDKAGDLPGADIYVRGGQIAAVGSRLSVEGANQINGSDMIVMPGFVDTHFHLWSSILRSSPESYFPLTLRVGPKYAPADSYRSAKLGAVECLLTGVTTVNDWCHNVMSPAHADAEVRALQETGIRARYSYGWGQDLSVDRTMDIPDLARIRAQWFADSELLALGTAMRTPVQYQRGNVQIDVLRKEFEASRRLGLPISMHNRQGRSKFWRRTVCSARMF